MKPYLILSLLFFILFKNDIYLIAMHVDLNAVDTASIRFFPLGVGNTYLYRVVTYPGIWNYKRSRIDRDTIVNNHRYFFCSNFPDLTVGWYRVDTSTSSLYYFNPSGGCANVNPIDALIDSLYMNKGQSYTMCNLLHSCSDTGTVNLFGLQFKTKSFSISSTSYTSAVTYAKNIGISYQNSNVPPHGWGYAYLIGCVVDGIVYGDTSIPIGIGVFVNNIPSEYLLLQNYPNPFNPVTKISYGLPKAGNVELKVYDILGREVAILVNENKQPGVYSVDFNASNLASGVYFYSVKMNDFNEVKKMVVVK